MPKRAQTRLKQPATIRRKVPLASEVNTLVTSKEEELFLKHYLKTGKVTTAAKQARPDLKHPQSQYVWGLKVLKNHAETIEALKEKHEITLDRVLKTVDEGLKAVNVGSGGKAGVASVEGMGGGAGDPLADPLTMEPDASLQPDHAIRHRFAETALKLTLPGVQATPQVIHNTQINIHQAEGRATIERLTRLFEAETAEAIDEV